MNLRTKLEMSSQANKRSRKIENVPSTLSLASVQMSDVREQCLSGSGRKKKAQATLTQQNMMGGPMTVKQAEVIMELEVEAIIGRGKPLKRLLDPYVV